MKKLPRVLDDDRERLRGFEEIAATRLCSPEKGS
jgi:hypothetical protein